MGSQSSPPAAPDPTATAKAQTSENIGTAIANSVMGKVNQTDQYGNTTTYQQTGNYYMPDPLSSGGQAGYYVGSNGGGAAPAAGASTSSVANPGAAPLRSNYADQTAYSNAMSDWSSQQAAYQRGSSGTNSAAYGAGTGANGYYLPTYSQTTSMSPENQAIYKSAQGAELNMANAAGTLSGQIAKQANTPLDLSQYQTNTSAPTASDINAYTNGAWQEPFNKSWTLQQQQLDQTLADQGIAPGSQAYGNSQFNFTQNQQNAMDQYSSSMYGTAATAALGAYNSNLAKNAQNAQMAQTQYTLPTQELGALLGSSSGQIATPNFQPVSTPTIPTTDYASIANNSYQNQLAQYKLQQANSSADMGGLFGLGSAAVSAGGMFL